MFECIIYSVVLCLLHLRPDMYAKNKSQQVPPPLPYAHNALPSYGTPQSLQNTHMPHQSGNQNHTYKNNTHVNSQPTSSPYVAKWLHNLIVDTTILNYF